MNNYTITYIHKKENKTILIQAREIVDAIYNFYDSIGFYEIIKIEKT